MSIRTVILVLLAISMAVPASAQEFSRRARQWQVSLEGRYTGPKDFDGGGGSKVEIEDDLGWGFGFDYNIDRRFSLGFGFTWRGANYVATIVDADDPTTTQVIPSRFDTSTFGARGQWNILKTTLTPYVNGSWSWLLVDSNIYAGTQTGCWWYPWWGYVCGPISTTYGASSWSASLGAGVRWEPSRNSGFFLKGGYEYGWTGVDLFESAHIVSIGAGLLM
jgi:opacity protein-like surface antigen